MIVLVKGKGGSLKSHFRVSTLSEGQVAIYLSVDIYLP